jgi:AraC-like DNA-binding protein
VFREVREVIDLPTLPWLRDLAPLTRPLARAIDAFALPLAYLAAITEFVRVTDAETPWVRAAAAQPLQRVLDLIRERNNARLRIRELAAAAGMSSTALSYAFRRAFGHSLKFHLTQDLLQRAMHDLMGTNKTVRQIALDLGYDRSAYFAFVFRRVLGLPPLKYRAVMHPRGANRQLYAPFPPEDRKPWSSHLRRAIPARRRV